MTDPPSDSPDSSDSPNHLRSGRPERRRPPLQFGLRSLLGITVAVSLLFGTLRWLEVSPLASALVLMILVVSVAAALGLVTAIAGSMDDDP